MKLFRKERAAAMIMLDLKWAREQLQPGHTASDEVLLIGLHKARYENTDLRPELREASRTWLEARNFTRRGGAPWPPAGQLPE